MAKPKRGGRRGSGGKGSVKGTITIGNDTIEFDGELTYNGNDKAVTGKVRKTIEEWETKRRTAKVEYAYAVDVLGNPTMKEKRGSKDGVNAGNAYHDSYVATHIHPREEKMLGGTFSMGDLSNFIVRNNTTKRAVAKEGVYSITKGENFDAQGAFNYFKSVRKQTYAKYEQRNKKYDDDFLKGSIGYNEYNRLCNKSFNTYLVENHKKYSAGQKQYGYTYTLERGN